MKNNLKKNALILLPIIASFGISACGSGSAEAESRQTEEMSIESEIGHPIKTVAMSINGVSEKVGFNDIRIGEGFDPDTGVVFDTSEPTNPGDFTWFTGRSADETEKKELYKVPLQICQDWEQKEISQELSSITQSDAQQVIQTNTKVAANYGLAALKGSTSLDYSSKDSNQRMTISKIIGVQQNCSLSSGITGSSDKKGAVISLKAQQYREAILKSNSALSKAITDISNATSYEEKESLINRFYTNFGKFMISDVVLSKIGRLTTTMTKNNSSTSDSVKIAAAASFSYGLNGGAEAGASYASAERFDTTGWDINYNKYVFPINDPNLTKALGDAEAKLAETKKAGITDFDSAKQTIPVVTAPTVPSLKDLDTLINPNGKTLIENKMAYEQIKLDLPKLKKLISSYETFKDNLDAITSLHNKLKANSEKIRAASADKLGISTQEYSIFLTEYEPQINAIATSGIINADSETVYSKKFATYTALVGKDKEITEKELSDFNASKTQNEQRRNNSPTFTSYLESIYKKDHPTENNFNDWFVDLAINHMDLLTQYKKSYSVSSATAPKSALNKAWLSKNNTNSKMLNSELDDPIKGLYKGSLVTNFSLVAWDQIFPELINLYSIDDTNGIFITKLEKTITDYIELKNYLHFINVYGGMASHDLVSDWTIADPTLEKELTQLIPQLKISRISPTEIKFNAKNYKISTIAENTDNLDLYKAIEAKIEASNMYNSSEFKEWKKAYDYLKKYSAIGTFANIPGYDLYGQKKSSLPILMTNVKEVPQPNEQSPFNLIVSAISLLGFDGKAVKAKQFKPLTTSWGDYDNIDFSQGRNISNNLENISSSIEQTQNGKPTLMLGVMPILTQDARVINNTVKNVILVDSSGHIWNTDYSINKTDKSETYNDYTNKYTLKISGSVDNPSIEVEEPRLYEYHYNFKADKGDTPTEPVNETVILDTYKYSNPTNSKLVYFGEQAASCLNSNQKCISVTAAEGRQFFGNGNIKVRMSKDKPISNSYFNNYSSSDSTDIFTYDSTNYKNDNYFNTMHNIYGHLVYNDNYYGIHHVNEYFDSWNKGSEQYSTPDKQAHRLTLYPVTTMRIKKILNKIPARSDAKTLAQPLFPTYMF